MDHVSIKSAFAGLEKYFIRGFLVGFTLVNKHSIGYRVFTILTISLVFTLLLTMAAASQVMAAAPNAAPSDIRQCKAATATTITLCWTAATIAGGSPGIESYYITNATETCSGSGADRSCSFGAQVASFNLGLNRTGGVTPAGSNTAHGGGTGSAVTVANFTGLSAGQLYQFKIYGQNDHGLSAASDVFQAGTAFGGSQSFSNSSQVFGNGTNFGASTTFAANQDFANFQNFGASQTFGAGTGFAQDQTFNGTQDFSASSILFDSGTQFDEVQTFGTGANFTGATTFTGANTFGDSATFGKDADFSIGGAIQTFGDSGNFSGVAKFGAGNHVFGANTLFAQDQTFNGTKDFSAGSILFDSGTQFSTVQTFGTGANFTGATTFTGANTFGDSATFGKDADFSIGGAIQTFGDSGNFSGVAKFGAGNHVFGASSIFAQDQPFLGAKDFSAASMGFGSGTTFDTVQTFGTGANFTGKSTFTGANTFGVDAVFGDGSIFPASQIFGKGANFTGKMTFSGTQTFPQDAEFAAGQEFVAGTAFTFDDFAMFNAGTDFGAARTFDIGTQFDSTMTFYEDMVFGEATKFGDSQVFGLPMTFGDHQMFGANTDFTALSTFEFKEGTAFGAGTTFATDQVIPLNTVPSFGLMLEAFTCLDAACKPTTGDVYLAPGEFLSPGTDPAAIQTSLSSSDPSVSIPGLGFVMNFTTVSGTGTTSVDPIDPSALPGSGDSFKNQANPGSRNVGTATGAFDTVGTALDISAGTATVSGDIQITMPYDDTTLAPNVSEADLEVLHYITATETWEVVSNCTIDTAANDITCTGITSLSPFSIGAAAAAANPGGMNCDRNAYGSGKSLAIHEITWDVEEANEVQVIASSKCGPVNLKVFTQQTIASGGLAQEQPYLADNKVVMRAPVQHTVLDVSASQSFRVLVENGWNSFDQTIYTDLHGSSGTLLLNFQKQDYSHVRLFMDDEPQLAAAPSSGMFMDPEPQLVMEAIDHTILRQNYDAEPQLTPAEMEIWASTHSDAEPQLTEQEKQMSFLDWFFSLFS